MLPPALTSVFRTSDGNKIHGIFSDPEDRFEGDDMRAPRIFRTNEDAPVSSGSVVSAHDGQYILFLHTRAPGQKRYLAFQVTHRVKWSRKVDIIDHVTNMKTTSRPKELDPDFPLYVQPSGLSNEQGMERPKYLIRCPAGVEIGDILGEFTVHTMQRVPGASIIGAY